jgi:hypothetical protein
LVDQKNVEIVVRVGEKQVYYVDKHDRVSSARPADTLPPQSTGTYQMGSGPEVQQGGEDPVVGEERLVSREGVQPLVLIPP